MCVRQSPPDRVLLVVQLHALRAWQAEARGQGTTLHASSAAGAGPTYLNSTSILKYLSRTPKYPWGLVSHCHTVLHVIIASANVAAR
jgi:hypothetical protein